MPAPLPGTAASPWLHRSPVTTYPRLDGDLSVDVVVIGGGIVGLTAALLLKRGGARVAVVEAGRVGRGASGHAPARLSALGALDYSRVLGGWDQAAARAYAASRLAAVERVARLVEEEGIECDFERVADHLWAEGEEGAQALEREAVAAGVVGLELTDVERLPAAFGDALAARLDGQAQLDPHRYATGLARAIPGEGSHVLERTRGLELTGDEPCRLRTADGSIVAGDAIVATQAPFLARAAYFARMRPERSGLIAVRPRRAARLGGSWTGLDEPGYGVREVHHHGERLVLVSARGGGSEHNGESGSDLERFARERFGELSVRFRWSLADHASLDGVPYAGRITPLATRTHVAAGFAHGGLSAGTAAAQVLADALLRRPNHASWVYDPRRLRPLATARSLLAGGLARGRRLVGG